MAVLPFKRIVRKCHSGNQIQFTFPPTNYALFNDFLTKPPPPELTISEVKHQVIPLSESYLFRRVENNKVDAICQTMKGEEKQDRVSNSYHGGGRQAIVPLMNMVKQQRCDNLKDCYRPSFATPLISQGQYFIVGR